MAKFKSRHVISPERLRRRNITRAKKRAVALLAQSVLREEFTHDGSYVRDVNTLIDTIIFGRRGLMQLHEKEILNKVEDLGIKLKAERREMEEELEKSGYRKWRLDEELVRLNEQIAGIDALLDDFMNATLLGNEELI